METLVVVIALAAAAGGGLMLLGCLAGRKATLVKAFNLQREMAERRQEAEDHQQNE